MVGKLETLGRQAYQGLTFGFGDELIDAPTAALVAALTGQKFSDVWKEARQISKENIAKDWDENTAIALGANIAGSVPFGLAAAGKNVGLKGLSTLDKASDAIGAGKFARAITQAGTRVSDWASTGGRAARAAKSGLVGAGFGATAGLGAGEDTPEGRMVSALLGGVVGGAAGGAAGAISRGAPTVKSVAKKTASQVSANQAEDEFLRQLLMRPDLSDMQKQAIALQGLSKKTGIELTLPEMLAQTDVDPILGQQSKLVKSPETAGAAQALLQRRMGNPIAGQPGQIITGLQNVSQQLAPGSYDELAQGLIKSGREGAKRITEDLSAKAGPLYQEAFKSNRSIASKELDAILDSPAGKEAMARTLEIFQNEGKLLGLPDKELGELARELGIRSKGGVAAGLKMQTYNMIKRGLDDMVNDAISQSKPGTTSARAKSLMTVRSRLLQELDALDATATIPAGRDAATGRFTPAMPREGGGLYAQARNVYSSQPETIANRQLMGELANIDKLSPEKVIPQLYSGTPGTAQRTSQSLGPQGSRMAAAAKLQDIIGGLKSGQMPRQMDADTINMLRTYAGPDADLVTDYLKVVDRARMGERYLRGSQTDTLRNIGQGMDDAANVALDVATMNKVGLAKRGIDAISDAVKGSQKEQYSRDLLNIFTTPRGMEVLDEAVKTQQRLMSMPAGRPAIQAAAPASQALTQSSMSQQNYSPIPAMSYTPIPAMAQSSVMSLPQGYTVRENKNQLPQGYTIRGGQ